MEYNFRAIEKKWQQHWKDTNAYKVENNFDKPKCYVLDMFPYPSGAGLHVGHPLGYIASDIYARYKRLKGFNVLHPMGYDAFGLPAEQYAIEHGVHPAISTDQNINNFRKQLDNIGFSFDWSREVRTSDPHYYKWTQWIFLQLFKSFYNRNAQKAESIDVLIKAFEEEGNATHVCPGDNAINFTAAEWKSYNEKQQQDILMHYRLSYVAYGEVNWCEALGTVLANDEVINGVSERGGYPVVKKKLRQWYLRITEYADRLLEGLQRVDFSEAMKEMQSNWIGKSEGAEITFPLSISPRRGEEMKKIIAEKEDGVEKDIDAISTNADNTKQKDQRGFKAGSSPPLQGEAGVRVQGEPGMRMPGFGYAKYGVDNTMNLENAKQMRNAPTEAEKVLWSALQNKKIGYKFRRQHPVENYITDFICLDVWLIVEVDGGYHNSQEQKEDDNNRDAYLKKIGFTTLRFTNEQILHSLDDVLEKIKQKADELKIASAKAIAEDEEVKNIRQKNAALQLLKQKNAVEKNIDTESSEAINSEQKAQQSDEAGSASPLQGEAGVRVYTTRPDTIFGVDFMVIAPEHELIESITPNEQKAAVEEYITYVKSRSDRERQAEKKITGVFTGAYAINPFSGREIPIWISEYVLAGYGTGAIMAVPCGDERDFKFAKHFNIPITNIIGDYYNGEEANPTKDAALTNSDFLNGTLMRDAIGIVINQLEVAGIGKRKVNYKMRDAAFSRQRYWGEPFPIVWKDGIAYPLDESELPLELPHVDNYKPGPEAEGPLANVKSWAEFPSPRGERLGVRRETNTMPGYAGSSWYFLRYMDPQNDATFCDKKVSDYWNQVDLYIGGTEHAVGHLLYSRLWTKALYDLDYISFEEPYKRLVNQGMLQGFSQFIYRFGTPSENINDRSSSNSLPHTLASLGSGVYYVYFSSDFLDQYFIENGSGKFHKKRIPIEFVDTNNVDLSKLSAYNDEYKNSVFVTSKGHFRDGKWYLNEINQTFTKTNPSNFKSDSEIEKISKSKLNTVDPSNLVEKYGADTFRMYEMFLGPVEQSKPWDTKGIEGVHRFLKKLWRLFFDEDKSLPAGRQGKVWNDNKATDAELKVLHKAIKKVEDDTERFSFNTAVSAFMVCVNELSDLKCSKKEILEPLVIMLAPYAPHIAAELYNELQKASPAGRLEGVLTASYPKLEEKYLVESAKEYPVSINGKLRTTIKINLDAAQDEVQQIVLSNDVIKKWVEDKEVKKFIFVKNKMVNVVV